MSERNAFFKKLFLGDLYIWIAIASLLAISVIEVYSSIQANVTVRNGDYNREFYRHIFMILTGLGITLSVVQIGVKRLFSSKLTVLLVVGAFLSWVMLLLTPKFGDLVNGARRTMFGIQWSELVKVFYVIFLAFWIGQYSSDKGLMPTKKGWITLFVVYSLWLVPIGLENMSGLVLLTVVTICLLLAGGLKLKPFLCIMGMFLSFALVLGAIGEFVPAEKLRQTPLHRLPTWVSRVEKSFFGGKAEEDPKLKFVVNDENYQVSHAKMAVANSNVIGNGVAGGRERFRLPQAFSDYIFSIILEELGLFVGLLVIFSYLCVLWRAIVIAYKSENMVYAMLTLACALLIVFQAMINMAVGVALGDFVTGQPLPFVSKGGTSIWMTGVLFGIILSVSVHVKTLQNKRKEKQIVVEESE
ncbi:MAG: FtsW/RodA/SpoVE family cell cycle protein [Paludibacteraceae bacterium]|nr:FtsW/RodA/SpoVE family cell cycle protein [Paludibacteraceae bacterium]